MKLFSILIAFFLLGCSTSETPVQIENKTDCSCERKFYSYSPAMIGPDGKILVPAKYNYISSQFGSFDCVTSNGYVAVNVQGYSHQKTLCK